MTATLYWRSAFRRGAGSASRQPAPSISSGPAIAASPSSRSSALRPMGPMTEMSDGASRPGSAWPRGGAMPYVGLCP